MRACACGGELPVFACLVSRKRAAEIWVSSILGQGGALQDMALKWVLSWRDRVPGPPS